MLSFWHRLRTGSSNKISHILFKFAKKQADENTFDQKWGNKIKEVLNNLGLGYIWNYEGITATKLKSTVKLRLHDAFIQNWESDLQNNKLCTNYRLIKKHFGTQPYLISLSKDLRTIMCRFVTGSHNLPISDRRYDTIDERNKCPLCLSDIGDEYHYIMTCKAFEHIRPKYICNTYINRPNTLKFQKLFSCRDLTTLTKLCKFIKIILHVFRL